MADSGAPARGLLRMLHVEVVVQAIHQLQLQAGIITLNEGSNQNYCWLCRPLTTHLAVHLLSGPAEGDTSAS